MFWVKALSGGTWKHRPVNFCRWNQYEDDEGRYWQRESRTSDFNFSAQKKKLIGNLSLVQPGDLLMARGTCTCTCAKIKPLYFKISAVKPQMRTLQDPTSSFTQHLLILIIPPRSPWSVLRVTLTLAVTSRVDLGQRIKQGKGERVSGGRGGGERRETGAWERHKIHYIPVESLWRG